MKQELFHVTIKLFTVHALSLPCFCSLKIIHPFIIQPMWSNLCGRHIWFTMTAEESVSVRWSGCFMTKGLVFVNTKNDTESCVSFLPHPHLLTSGPKWSRHAQGLLLSCSGTNICVNFHIICKGSLRATKCWFYTEFFCSGFDPPSPLFLGVMDLLGHFWFLVTKKGKKQNFTKHPKWPNIVI